MRASLPVLTGLLLLAASAEGRADPWSSPADCAAALKAGQRLARKADRVRVGSWHLDGFPDRAPGAPPPRGQRLRGPGRDVAWLACGLAWLNVDVVALQGVRPGADAMLRRVAAALGRHTRSRWSLKLDACTGRGRERVGLLWNTKRLKASKLAVEPLLNPHRRACQYGQRPGLRGYFRAPGGLDFHLISVHLPEGGEMSAFRLRGQVMDQLKDAYQAAQRAEPDPDVLVAGVWNPVGCPACPGARTPAAALSRMVQRLTALDPGFRVFPANRSCSRVGGGETGLVSQMVASRGFVEIARSSVRIQGRCAAEGCTEVGSGPSAPAVVSSLSPHCPLIVDIQDRDEDPKREELGSFVEAGQGGGAVAGKLPRKLSPDQIRAVLGKLKPQLRRACRRAGSAAMTVTIVGETGKVMKATGAKGTPACALRVMRQAVFPRFQISAIEIEIPVIW